MLQKGWSTTKSDAAEDGGDDAMEKEEFLRDPMTEVIGPVGPFQIVWHVVLGLSIIIHAWQMFANKWLTYKVHVYLVFILTTVIALQ